MKYFKSKTVEGLKREYRELALANHPDHGGNSEVMKEINIEFKVASRMVLEAHPSDDIPFDIISSLNEIWANDGVLESTGSRFDETMTCSDIAKAIRTYCKERYPMYKFSVTKDRYRAITIKVKATAMTYDEAEHDEDLYWAMADVNDFAESFTHHHDDYYNDSFYANAYIHMDPLWHWDYKQDKTLRGKTCKYLIA